LVTGAAKGYVALLNHLGDCFFLARGLQNKRDDAFLREQKARILFQDDNQQIRRKDK
jgi:hypothetical protein